MDAVHVGWSAAALMYVLGVVDRWTDLSGLGAASPDRRVAARRLALLLVLGWPLVPVALLVMRMVPDGRR
jgi:hypothetical protein